MYSPGVHVFYCSDDTRYILRMHNERIYSGTLVIHNSCITHAIDIVHNVSLHSAYACYTQRLYNAGDIKSLGVKGIFISVYEFQCP